jgi:ligand-binding sensor domain-containing protein
MPRAQGLVRKAVALAAVLACMLLVCCPCAFALDPKLDINQYAHTAWKIREGFSKGQILSIVQTPDGYLWLGTEFGLLRFDGVRNVPWKPPADQHLPSNYVMSLLAQRDGTLWIGTDKGLASWKDGRLTQYPVFTGHFIYKLLEDREGSVWVSDVAVPTGKVCAIHNGSVQCYGEDGSLGIGVFNLFEDSRGNIWGGGRTGLWRWKNGPPKFYPVPEATNGIGGLNEDDDGALLMGLDNGIGRFVDGKTEEYRIPGRARQFRPGRMLRDRDGGLWIGSSELGLVHVHQGRTDVFGPSDGLSGESAATVFEDREGNIWVGTIDGLDRFRDFALATFTAKHGLSKAPAGAVLADRDGSVWLATEGGLNRWSKGRITVFGKGNKPDGKLNGNIPHSLFQDDRGRIWVSTRTEFGYLENDRFVSISGIPGGLVRSIVEDTGGNLWIANQEFGLFKLLRGSEVQRIPWAGLGRKDFATTLVADPLQGGLWLGFFLGGVAYFKDDKVHMSYAAADGLGDGRVNGLRLDRDGTLWAATEGGLSRLKNGRITTLTSKNGLPCDTVHWVTEDEAHSLWVNMSCGLARIAHSQLDGWATAVERDKSAKPTIQATVFDSSDGVMSRVYGTGYSP